MTKKIAIITCYKDPDYIRSRALRAALGSIPNRQLIVIKNSHTGVLRYVEVLLKVAWVRISQRPDLYILTFRGYEVLPFVRLLSLGKPLYFDEFINLVEWLVYEHHKIREGSLGNKLIYAIYRPMLMSVQKILTDTSQHALYSAGLMQISSNKFFPIPVGADESIFRATAYRKRGVHIEVFYYGSMLPLHGIEHVCRAALLVKDENIRFTLIGGNEDTEKQVHDFVARGARITYKRRVPFEDLPKYIQASDVCLGGPFGDTVQAGMVITGKTYQFLASNRVAVVGKIHGKTAFKDKENCLLVPLGSAEAIAGALRWAAKNTDQLPLIAKNGRRLYETSFSITEITKRLEKII